MKKLGYENGLALLFGILAGLCDEVFQFSSKSTSNIYNTATEPNDVLEHHSIEATCHTDDELIELIESIL